MSRIRRYFTASQMALVGERERSMGRISTGLLIFVGFAAMASFGDAPQLVRTSATIELGPDRGQNFGTLFEILDDRGQVLAGAGFLGAYNTQPRSDRTLLQVFVRSPQGSIGWQVERLPPVPGKASGYYPFSIDGKLYVHDRRGRGSENDPTVHRFDETEGRWIGEPGIAPYSTRVAGKMLIVTGESVVFDGKLLLQPTPGASFGEHYFGGGNLFIKEVNASASPVINRLIVCPWKPESNVAIERHDEWTLELPIAHEFIYTFGQWHDETLVVSNNGRVSRFDENGWTTLREPVPNVSYQIYSGMNVEDQLLFGHYPTGEIFTYEGAELIHNPGWPPVLPGVARSAREAQTLAIYGGDVYAGVWPWGEVWRRNIDTREWAFARRFFQQPLPSSQYQHPYETETQQVDGVANLWGQRITGLQPHGTGLVVTTSSKTGAPWTPKFAFLTERQREEYGAVYRVVIPGNLAVPTEWKKGPTSFEVTVSAEQIRVSQDGRLLGEVDAPECLATSFRPAKVVWGEGQFGPFAGTILSSASSVQASASARPWRAVYLHLNRLIPSDSDASTAERIVFDAVTRAQRAGLNTILPYANDSAGRTCYSSRIASTRCFGDLDALDLVVRACRSYGMAVYPVVCMTVSGGETPTGILETHPEWGLRHPDGSPLGYVSPANAQARTWMASLVQEVASRYRPDGVILDYIRFHNRPLRLDPSSETQFEASLPPGLSQSQKADRLQTAKEAAVTDLVAEVSSTVRSAQPGAAIGAYCWGAYTLKNHQTAQVWDRWVQAGYIDLVNVSGYVYHSQFGDEFLAAFEKRMRAAHEANSSLPRQAMLTFALGMKTSHGSVRSVDDVSAYLDFAKRTGLVGVAFFSWDSLLPYLDELETRGTISSAFGP